MVSLQDTLEEISIMRFCGIVILILFVLGGCRNTLTNPPASQLTIFAAASLTEAFIDMVEAFKAENPDAAVLLNFAGSQTLRLQLEQGARADVFASANQSHADALHDVHLINSPVIFAHNQLVVIMPAENPGSVETLVDLTRPGLKIVLAGSAVPAGRYARKVLEKLNTHPDLQPEFSARVLDNVVSEEDTVKGVVAKIQLGEADAGMVYVSDLTPAVADKIITLPIPPDYNVSADYPIAVVSDTQQPELAQAFIEFVLSSQGQAILVDHGFQTVSSTPTGNTP